MNKKNRIAIVINSLSGGGAEKVMLTLATSLHQLGHEPHFILLQDKGEYQVPEFILCHACFGADETNLDVFWKRKKSAQRLNQFIREIEAEFGLFDLFLSNLDKSNMLMTQTDLKPLYCVVHNSVEAQLKRQKKLGPLAYLKMRYAKKCMSQQDLICVSKGVADEVLDGQLITPKSIQTIYNPIDLDKIRALSKKEQSDIPSGDYLIHVGRIAKQKRHDILFQALKMARTSLPLVLLCNNPRKAKKLAKKYGVEDRVIIPGFQTNPYVWIKNAKALVLSSDFEGLGMVLIEALACGTPVVSTDCPHGPNEILTEHLSEFLVPRQNPELLAKKIDLILSTPPNLVSDENFTKFKTEVVAKQYLELIP